VKHLIQDVYTGFEQDGATIGTGMILVKLSNDSFFESPLSRTLCLVVIFDLQKPFCDQVFVCKHYFIILKAFVLSVHE